MKRIIASLVLMLMSTVSYAGTYVCTAYLNGVKVGEPIKVNASKTSVAETKGAARLRKEGVKLDYVDCK